MGRITTRRKVQKVSLGDGAADEYQAAAEVRVREDVLAVEEPLEIRVGGQSLAVTMRTPGHDVELAAGFLVSEGIIAAREQFRTAIHCAGEELNTYNVLDVNLAPGVALPSEDQRRSFYTTSSCGLCGKRSIESVRTVSSFDVAGDPLWLDAATVATYPDRLRAEQAAFDRTGGLHAAGLFDAASGELLVVREDVGRHNAVDKVVGWALLQGRLPLRGTVLQVSGRASFELVQKAVMAGIPMLTAVSAASSLAAELADEAGLTLVGFLRGDRMNVYTHAGRVVAAVEDRSADGASLPARPQGGAEVSTRSF